MKKRIWPILFASVVGLAILLSLGVWQLQRLQWKQDIIAKIDQALAAEPVDYSTLKSQAPDYALIKVRGTFSSTVPYRMIASLNGGPGWRLIQPFVSSNDMQLLVDRGVAAENQLATAPLQQLELVGVLRYHAANQGFFDPNNDVAANRWYWWDTRAMQKGLKELPMEDAVLHLLPKSPGTEGLYVDPPKANLRNNHLGYAITWFGLALVLIVMTGLFVRARIKEKQLP